jgi:hypothetical protein
MISILKSLLVKNIRRFSNSGARTEFQRGFSHGVLMSGGTDASNAIYKKGIL